MSRTVCLNANTIVYPTGGGHRWVYLNWALGLRSAGCRVIWSEGVLPSWGRERIAEIARVLADHLRPFGLDESLALYSYDDNPIPPIDTPYIPFEQTLADADLLLDIAYGSDERFVRRYRRSALIDIDPGILQVWVHQGNMKIAPHDVYFTIGETVGQPGSRVPDIGIPWNYLPPCVALDAWPVAPAAPAGAPFTTVSQWRGGDWIVHGDDSYNNEKREGFLPFLDLPGRVRQPLELALGLGEWDQDERDNLLSKGWRVRHASEVTASPHDYQRYVQSSRGEFSCCKPSCVRLQNAWISDRTICYLASGKPAVVQHTGPSRFLPDNEGLFRFRTIDEAASMLDRVAADYERQSAKARALAEEFFDARKVCRRLLEIALP